MSHGIYLHLLFHSIFYLAELVLLLFYTLATLSLVWNWYETIKYSTFIIVK